MSNIEITGLNDYQEKALRTLKPAKDCAELRLHSAMGLAGESSEHLSIHVMGEDSGDYPLDKAIIELGDILWYAPVMCLAYDANLDDVYLRCIDVPAHLMLAPVQGLVVCSGEILDAVKKEVFYGKEPNKDKILDNLSMILLFAQQCSSAYGITLLEVMRRNIAKLAERFPDAFDAHKAIHKNEEAENDAAKA